MTTEAGDEDIWSSKIVESLTVDRKHVDNKVKDFCEEIDLASNDSKELITLLKKVLPKITHDELDMWKAYGDTCPLFSSTSVLEPRLQTIVTYCESTVASSLMKNKLRYITKTLIDKPEIDPIGILLLLASHGQVCNVMKEVGVNMAYSVLMGTTKEDMKKLSIENLVLNILYDEREVIVEELFIATGSYINTHPLMSFRNGLYKYIGLNVIPDEHCDQNAPKNVEQLDLFWKKYNSKRIIDLLERKINDKEVKKIPYDMIVNWFKDHSLLDDEYEFLGVVFDMDTGLVKRNYISYMLTRLNILECKDNNIVLPKSSTKIKVEKEEKKSIILDNDVNEKVNDDNNINDDDILSLEKPRLERQVSEDPKMPVMVRQVSADELKQVKTISLSQRIRNRIKAWFM